MLSDALGVACLLAVLAALVWLWPCARVEWPPKPLSPGLAALLNAPPPPVPNCRCALSPADSIAARCSDIGERLSEKRDWMVMDALKGDPEPEWLKQGPHVSGSHQITMPCAMLQIGNEPPIEVLDVRIDVAPAGSIADVLSPETMRFAPQIRERMKIPTITLTRERNSPLPFPW